MVELKEEAPAGRAHGFLLVTTSKCVINITEYKQ